MRQYEIDPATFDGGKYARRAGLNIERDLYCTSEGGATLLHVPDSAPAPDASDTLPPAISEPAGLRDKIVNETATASEALAFLSYLARVRRV